MNTTLNNLTMMPPDQEVRIKAVDPTHSFAVSAPAGSGKTGLLTQRVLQLLARCDYPEEILAITFTRKAAGEMQDRIIHALWDAAETDLPADPHAQRTWSLARAVLKRDQELEWHLLESPQRLRITTIDSLCRSITQQLPLASGIGAQPDTLDNPDLAYRMAVRELFKLLDQESPLREHLAHLLRHLDNNLQSVENLLSNLLATREQWLSSVLLARHQNARHYFETVLGTVITEHLIQVKERLQPFGSDLITLADQAAQHLQAEGERKNRIADLLGITDLPKPQVDDLPRWLAIADFLLTNSGSFRARLTKAEGFPAGKQYSALKDSFNELIAAISETHPDTEELIAEIRYLPPATYADEQWQLLESLTYILPQLVAELMLVFKQLAATDYSAISQAALLALGEEDQPSDLALHLDYRIRHLLVDEFQDTASPQLELLKKLTQGWQSGDGRTLFIVGDGMQSCYGFRNANVGLFLDARQHGIGSVPLDALDLQVNFRSQARIVNWVNQLFEKAFPSENDIARGAVRYSPSIAFKAAIPDDSVQVHFALYQGESTNDDDDIGSSTETGIEHARQCEATKIVELIQRAQREDPDGSIAILVRTRNHLNSILPALNSAGLDYLATDIDRLSSRMAIMDIHSLARALSDLSDRIAWLSILRAPWCGLTLSDLHAIATTNLGELSPHPDNQFPILWQQLRHYTQISQLSQEGKKQLDRVVPVLEASIKEAYRKPLRQWVEGTWLALGGPACVIEPQDIHNIHSYFSLLDHQSDAGRIRDWDQFNQALNQLFASPNVSTHTRLQVMTIHKSKGLEFDTVIIPGLDRTSRGDDKELLLWQERLSHQGEKQLLLGSFAPIGKENDPLYDFMRKEKSKRQQFEATRLLYVGCTRAIKNLHLLACIRQDDESLKAPGKNSLLNSIWDGVKNEAQPINSTNAFIKEPTTAHQKNPTKEAYLRLSNNWQLPSFAPELLLAQYRGRGISNTATENPNDNPLNIPELETRQNRLARHTGTLIHAALEMMVTREWIANNRRAEEYIQQQQPLWVYQLGHAGWTPPERDWSIQKITRALTHVIADKTGRWILDHRHDNSACELSLIQKDHQGIRESIIDRTFTEGDTRWIIDYKSSEPLPNESLEEFIQNESNRYKNQLIAYKQAMRGSHAGPIRMALYFVIPCIFSCIDE